MKGFELRGRFAHNSQLYLGLLIVGLFPRQINKQSCRGDIQLIVTSGDITGPVFKTDPSVEASRRQDDCEIFYSDVHSYSRLNGIYTEQIWFVVSFSHACGAELF
ncbi:hypothetical protein RSAG8_08683, partial [Rhizoctonia solani AG-8 WAC10335]